MSLFFGIIHAPVNSIGYSLRPSPAFLCPSVWRSPFTTTAPLALQLRAKGRLYQEVNGPLSPSSKSFGSHPTNPMSFDLVGRPFRSDG